MIETQKYIRKPFEIEAVEITEENMEEVAEWCQGEIREESHNGGTRKFIKVRVHHPLSERQTKAYVEDWILYANRGFKVYNPKAFAKNFDPKDSAHNPNQLYLVEHRGEVFQALAADPKVKIETVDTFPTPGDVFRGDA